MFNLVSVEWLKLNRSIGFKWFALLTAPTIWFLSYLFANGFKSAGSYVTMWNSIIAIIFLLGNICWMLSAGLLMISWQQQEHQDNTFKFYEILPIEKFNALLIRFNLFYFFVSIGYLLSMVISFKLIDLIFINKFGTSSSLSTNTSVNVYIFEGIKATILLSYPLFMILFFVTAKTNNITYSILSFIFLLILGFQRLPDWVFFSSLKNSFRYLSQIFSYQERGALVDLQNLYIYNIGASLLLIVTLYYLTKGKHFFYYSHDKI